MKKLILSLVILISLTKISVCQYSADWGKYMNDPVPGADFLQNDQPEQLTVDVKKKSTNEEYIYVTGRSQTRTDHESACGANEFYYGSEDDFLAKYDKCGNLQWFRFLGSDNDNTKDECGDFADCIVVDRDPVTDSTYIYIAGYSYTHYDPPNCSTCVPCSSGNSTNAFSCKGDTCVFQKSKNSAIDAFIAKYDEKGNLVKWTYFGGNGDDYIIGISVFRHDVYITGTTLSTPEFLPAGTPMFDSTLSTQSDAFVARMDAGLCTVKFFSYMGGLAYERSHSIHCFKTGGSSPQTEFYISGAVEGDMGDTSYHPLNTHSGGGNDAFLSLWKLNKSTGVFKPQWLKYLGGISDDRDREMIIDNGHNAIVTGVTLSKNLISSQNWTYPKSSFYDTTSNGMKDAFLAKFDADGNGLWCTYIGGDQNDQARGLARYSITSGTTTTNYIAISGGTRSTNFPVQLLHPPFQTALNGGFSTTNRDAFVAVLTDPASPSEIQQLEFSSYFGGQKNEWDEALIDYGPDLELGGNNEMYLTFYTRSTDIENYISSPGYRHNTNGGGDTDGFLAKILNSSISKQFDCTSFDWGTSNLKKNNEPGISESELELYPNPTDGRFSLILKLEETPTQKVTVEITDVTGRKVYKEETSTTGGILHSEILLPSSVQQGIYFIRVSVKDQLYRTSLIYQK